jgi:hypothetical protein
VVARPAAAQTPGSFSRAGFIGMSHRTNVPEISATATGRLGSNDMHLGIMAAWCMKTAFFSHKFRSLQHGRSESRVQGG